MGKHYTEEFRREAVRLVHESKSSVAQVARDLGVNAWTLKDWIKIYRESARESEPRRAETLEEENRRLRRELSIVKQEREILKKATAYFAKEQL